jgi:hypothetical protein
MFLINKFDYLMKIGGDFSYKSNLNLINGELNLLDVLFFGVLWFLICLPDKSKFN